MIKSTYNYSLGLAFYSTATKCSRNIALKYPDQVSYTYEELNKLSNKLARFLLSSGLQKGDVVAIFNEKSIYAYSLMLACLKAGVIYTNLDTSSPWLRLEKILDRCTPKIIFFDEGKKDIQDYVSQKFSTTSAVELWSGSFRESLSGLDDENLRETSHVHGADAAYIMFTSGSTGFPKGAVMSHNNVLNFIEWGKTIFSITEADVFTNANPIYFDNSVFDFYTSIFSGATLVPLSHDLVKDPKALVKTINQSGCTIWFSVPSLLVYLLTTKVLSEKDFPSITRISFGGEGFPKNKLKQLFELFGNRVTLFNVYGPTECTCICSSYVISQVDFENMNELAPLGYIAPNFGYKLLPIDETNSNIGELALLGPCVGMGYFNDPERTRNSFIQNTNVPFNQVMYKTGDVVEKAPNGYLYFRGRVDNQVKHMGYRIELEEIEAAFSSLDYVNEICVVYERITAEFGQIKAFVSVSDKEISNVMILEDIKNLLPAYMVPRIIHMLELLPKNANGKIDRKQLSILK